MQVVASSLHLCKIFIWFNLETIQFVASRFPHQQHLVNPPPAEPAGARLLFRLCSGLSRDPWIWFCSASSVDVVDPIAKRFGSCSAFFESGHDEVVRLSYNPYNYNVTSCSAASLRFDGESKHSRSLRSFFTYRRWHQFPISSERLQEF